MVRWGLAAFVFWTCGLAFAQSNANPDFRYGSVIKSFRKYNPGMVHFSLLYRGEASADYDVILVRGGKPEGWLQNRPGTIRSLEPGDFIGLFLVNRSDPALTYELIVDSHFNEGYGATVQVERAAPGEITVVPISDYGGQGHRYKYVYSTSSKGLLRRQVFWGGGLHHIDEGTGRLLLSGTMHSAQRGGPSTTLVVEPAEDGFETIHSAPVAKAPGAASVNQELESLAFGKDCTVMTVPTIPAERVVECVIGGQRTRFEAPRSTREQYITARPEVLTDRNHGEVMLEETIGPFQVEGDLLWFGLTFYDGEGNSGAGGFGSFDSATHEFQMRYLPELAASSVSALLVEPDAIWLAPIKRPEGAEYPVGLLRWDRGAEKAEYWLDGPLLWGMVRQGERLYAATGEGAAIFENGEFARYVVDVDEGGKFRLAKRELR